MQITKIDLKEFLDILLPDPEIQKFIFLLQEISQKRKEFLYFAGGIVRDYFIKKWYKREIPSFKDLDLVLEGDLTEFLKELFKKIKGKIILRSQFLTYKVKISLNTKEFLVDFITARKELYEEIAKLPKVFPSNFKDDIFRRDFSINALIVGLSSPYESYLIDLVNGIEDLKKGIIRPLYLNSFIDDPTRVFRGIRYKIRFDFDFSKEFFLALKIGSEKSSFKKLSPSRISNELKLYLIKEPEKNLKSLLQTTFELNIFEKLGIKVKKENFDSLIEIIKVLKDHINSIEIEKAFLLGLIDLEVLDDAYKLGFNEFDIKRMKKALEIIKMKLNFWNNLKLIEKVKIFEKIKPFYLLVLAVSYPFLKGEVIEFLKTLKKMKPQLTGEDLKKFGIKEGKEIGRVLELLREKIIEGKIKTKEDEEKFVKKLILNK